VEVCKLVSMKRRIRNHVMEMMRVERNGGMMDGRHEEDDGGDDVS